jgi:hypothetical protein
VQLRQFSSSMVAVVSYVLNEWSVKDTSIDDMSLLHAVETPELLLSLVTQDSSQLVIWLAFVIQIDRPGEIGVLAGKSLNLCVLAVVIGGWLRFHRCFRGLWVVHLECSWSFIVAAGYDHQQSVEE